jgi:hypothetical protein
VRAQLPALAGYLDSPDDGFRIEAAYLVSKFPEDADAFVPRIAELHAREQDPARRQVYELVMDALRRGESTGEQKALLEDLVFRVLS